MEKKGKQSTRGRKPQIPEEDDKQKESIMEEVSNISGKPIEVSVEKDKSPPPARMKRTAKKQKLVNAKKSGASTPSLPPTKKKKSDVKEKDVNTEVNESKSCEKGLPVPNLPGWRKEISIRKSGATAGKADVYFYSPAGSKLRSRPEVSAYLKQHEINDIKIEEFDFTKTVSKAVGGKNSLENSKEKAKTPKNKLEKKRPKPELKPVSAKKSRSEKSAVVPSPADTAEKNDTDGKSNKVLIKILESKPKKSRK